MYSLDANTIAAIAACAAASLLKGESSVHVDRVLDFYEPIAGLFVKPHGLLRSHVLPDRWTRHTFYWSAVCYWSKNRDYIDTVRQRPTDMTLGKIFATSCRAGSMPKAANPLKKTLTTFLSMNEVPNQITGANAGWRPQFSGRLRIILSRRPGVAQFRCWHRIER